MRHTSVTRLIAVSTLGLASLAGSAYADEPATEAPVDDTAAEAPAEDPATEGASGDVAAPEIPYEETRPPRPAEVASPARPGVPWERHLELGPDLIYAVRPVDTAGTDKGIRYSPAIGFGLHAQTALTEWLWVKLYFIDARHAVTIPNGALGVKGTVDLPTMKSYAFGLRISPTWQMHPRFKLWATGGAGWGRMEFDDMTIDDGGVITKVRDRADPFIEFPLGLGVGAELIPRWLSVHYEVTGSFIVDQSGAAVRSAQGIDSLGHLRTIGPFPAFGSSWVQSLGLSLIL